LRGSFLVECKKLQYTADIERTRNYIRFPLRETV
jgi:hypothetical protein